MNRLVYTIGASLLVHVGLVVVALAGSWSNEAMPLESLSASYIQAQPVAPVKLTLIKKQEPAKEAATKEPAKLVAKKIEKPRLVEPKKRVKPEPKPKKVEEPVAQAKPQVKKLVETPAPTPSPVPKAVVASAQGKAPAQPAEPATQGPSKTGSSSLKVGSPTVASSSRMTSRPEVGGGVDRAGLFKSYRKKIFLAVDRRKSIPRAARRARMTGTVYVLITLDGTGRILKAKVRKSSGHQLLDDTALATVMSLKVMPKPPEALAWTTKKITIPIRYTM